MTKKLLAKSLLKGDLLKGNVQICRHCIHWSTHPDRDHHFDIEWCEKKNEMTALSNGCFQWQWNKKLK